MDKVKINKTKKELINELEFLHQRMVELEKLETKHKQEGESLKECYCKLNSIFSSFTDLVFVLDRESRFTELYVPSEKLYVSPEEFIGKRHSEVMPAYIDKLFAKAFNRNKKEEVAEYEYPLEIAGKKQWYSAKLSPLFIDGEFTGAVAVVRNISEHKRVYQQLKESEERYRSLVDLGGKVGVAVVMLQDTDKGEGIQTFISDEWSRITGYSKEELLGMSFFDLLNPMYRKSSLDRHRRQMNGEHIPVRFEMSIIRKDGTEVPIELTSGYTTYQEKRANVAYICDITERKQMEQSLRESEEKYRLLAENITDVIYTHDMNFKFTYISTSVKQLRGYTAEEAMSQKPDEVLTPKSLKKAYNVLQKALAADQAGGMEKSVIRTIELELKCKDGSTIWAEAKTDFIRGSDRRPIGVLGVCRDITKRKKAQKKLHKLVLLEKRLRRQLEEQMKQRIEFTRALAHEMKTPMTPLVGATELLSYNLKDEPWSKLARQAYKGALDLDSRLDEFFDLTRSEIGKLKLDFAPIEPRQLLMDIIEYSSTQAVSSNHKLMLDIPNSLPVIWCDPKRLRQVLLNLLDNAFKHTPEGTEVTVKARRRGSFLVIKVSDTGPGIMGSKLENIFKPYNYHIEDENYFSGLGLGLALCKIYVELQDGKIWVENKPGKGCSFTFTIPVAVNKNISKSKVVHEDFNHRR